MTYLTHDTGMDGLDADVLAVEVESVHQGLGGPDQLVALPVGGAQAEFSLQIHSVVKRLELIKVHVSSSTILFDCRVAPIKC